MKRLIIVILMAISSPGFIADCQVSSRPISKTYFPEQVTKDQIVDQGATISDVNRYSYNDYDQEKIASYYYSAT